MPESPGKLVLSCLAALAALIAVRGELPAGDGGRRLIQFGWDEPSTRFLRLHIREMERMPFDGVVLNARYLDAGGNEAVLEWTGFGARPIPWDALEPALADLKATDFRRFTHNFLRFNVAPGDVDWWDDFSAIRHNARMAARLVGRGGLRGILFDVEQYESPVFSYRHQEHRGSRTYVEYARQVRRRGRELMGAFQAEAPGLTLFLTFGYALAGKLGDRPESHYGLLGPFLDGLFEAARGATRVVDGFEFSYGYHEAHEFEAGYALMHEAGRRLSRVPRAYSARLLAGFGLWLDWNWRKEGWDTEDTSANPFTPRELEEALLAALRRSDRYVWLYNEQPRWWNRERLPEAYVQAVRRARARLGQTDP